MITDQDVTKLKKTFLTHAEFKKYVKTLATKKDFGALKYDLGDLKIEVGELKDSIGAIHTMLDKFLGNYERLDSESKVCTVVQRRHTQQIEALAAHQRFILPA